MIQYAALFMRSYRSRLTGCPAFAGMTGRMTSPDLPAELRAALDARLQGLSRNEAAGPRRCDLEKISRRRRLRRIRSETDALAYALARMPATYAAVIASLNAFARSGRTSRLQACSISAPGRVPRRGRRPKRFVPAPTSRCSMPTMCCARLRSSLPRQARLRGVSYRARRSTRRACATPRPPTLSSRAT